MINTCVCICVCALLCSRVPVLLCVHVRLCVHNAPVFVWAMSMQEFFCVCGEKSSIISHQGLTQSVPWRLFSCENTSVFACEIAGLGTWQIWVGWGETHERTLSKCAPPLHSTAGESNRSFDPHQCCEKGPFSCTHYLCKYFLGHYLQSF